MTGKETLVFKIKDAGAIPAKEFIEKSDNFDISFRTVDILALLVQSFMLSSDTSKPRFNAISITNTQQ
jgi:hypothetical protein